ncbi:hypothetical protein ACFFGV_14170 [Pontibacillus salicampi]|uniref:YolD-like family protein n=1 Tax=Pontibacillus salicampi TaxID=1449801 RepID=A0ABV6LQW8_9BACI
MNHYLASTITKQQATTNIKAHLQSNWWKKIRNTNRLVSIEQMHIPFCCSDYHAATHSIQEGMEGRIAIEPINNIKAILPVDYEIHTTQQQRGFFPTHHPITKEEAHNAIYWELFTKEKKRQHINVSIQNQWTLHVPYWIGYIHNKHNTYDIICVDSITGKIDLTIKDTVLTYIAENGTTKAVSQ